MKAQLDPSSLGMPGHSAWAPETGANHPHGFAWPNYSARNPGRVNAVNARWRNETW